MFARCRRRSELRCSDEHQRDQRAASARHHCADAAGELGPRRHARQTPNVATLLGQVNLRSDVDRVRWSLKPAWRALRLQAVQFGDLSGDLLQSGAAQIPLLVRPGTIQISCLFHRVRRPLI